ncbi:hypothetical protein GCM10025882_23060 [Acinetobacter gyllenbergii]|uniref:Uncharacterized protein n=1 Tax=Acinetobacter gyllenbergii CIP 110306 = MTCC 11365 TaxID=1217657 RepID=A0A829HL81_9GAMM|nr:hypothetical protein [Acinetobacter gyllenbergii]EPF93350.1 hypothetical protein F957_00146 [Acinetobacter gyllenbergii CIP 110306 = MTCC 11365]ESK46946.1 hypothetical protein F987_01823 [Acinetobacter gyllenbergii NIPH 230]OBY75638.1 hypothetical protein NG55_02905 [Acinetobacter gyllenbergii]GMA11881.1 hypothetical protein GCM10025882_23060 [Acinetobacter gyllenbergii]
MDDVSSSKKKLKFKVYVMCGWPLILVLIGGAVGGGLGGIAYLLNLKLYNSNLSNIVKIILNILVGSTAIFLWSVIRAYIQSSF